VTHEYTLLTGGHIVLGGGLPDATAIAWAADTILAIGSDEEVRAMSRGDSRFVDLGGAMVRPATDGARLEVGGPADLAIEAPSPNERGDRALVIVRGGRVVAGSLSDLAGS